MNDDALDRVLERARPHFRHPPEPDVERVWAGVRARQQAPRLAGRFRSLGFPVAIAASLLVAFGLGRWSAPVPAPVPTPAPTVAEATVAPSLAPPIERTATSLLGETAALLTSLPTDAGSASAGQRFALQAQELLLTTRLLLDAGASSAPELRELLEDLELVLAQVARLRHHNSNTEFELINEALRERELVPRLRSAAAQLAADN